MAYPAERFIRLSLVDGRAQPAYAPNEAADHLEAYAPFLAETRQAIQAEIDEDRKAIMQEIADGERDEEDEPELDWVVACTVHEDGLISTAQGDRFARSDVFAAFGLTDPASPAPKA